MYDPFSQSQVGKIDKKHIYRTYEGWPALARDGFGTKIELSAGRLRKAYVLGMGGSAAGGDIIASWLSNMPGVEIAVFKGQLPIGDLGDALAIACSASGETEETIEMMKTAVKRGATVVSVSAGGRLMEVSRRLGVPHISMPKVVAPRYMLPFMVFSCLSVVNDALRLGCDMEVEDSFTEMDAEARAIGIGSPVSRNQSKKIALSLLRKTPVIYGARSTRGAGIRFKNVLNENAKKHALFDGLPDAFHNEIEAWEDPSNDFAPVFLRHPAEAERDRVRIEAMIGILSKLGMEPVQVWGRGRSNLAQLVTMVYRLDMVSYYVAVGLGRNPFPTSLIDRLKEES